MEFKNKEILLVGLGLVLGVFFYNNRKRSLTNDTNVTIDPNADCEKKWNSKADIDKGAIGATRDARKQGFMYSCVNNIAPQVIMN
jgi:hypothetical protein